MKKKKILLLIPLAVVAGLLIYSWAKILTTDIAARWENYLAVGLFIIPVYLFFKNFTSAVIATGIYLLVGTFGGFSLTADIAITWIRIGPLETPPFIELSFGIFILYFALNFGTLANIYLDYKKSKHVKRER